MITCNFYVLLMDGIEGDEISGCYSVVLNDSMAFSISSDAYNVMDIQVGSITGNHNIPGGSISGGIGRYRSNGYGSRCGTSMFDDLSRSTSCED